VRFIHAKRARSKPAELVGGLLQNLMERVPGYCGRDERRDCPESTRLNKLAVERRTEPHGLFHSFDAWEGELGRLIVQYNATVQDGRILSGKSPDQAFDAFWPRDNPPIEFDARCWHLLAHYVSEREVTKDGICFSIGGKKFEYRNDLTSAVRGKKVLAWFDPECPELLGVTDLKERNPFLVERVRPVDFLASLDRDGADGQGYREELAKVTAHNSYPKARFHVLKAKFERPIRRNLVAPAIQETGEAFTRGRGRLAAEERERQSRRRSVKNRAGQLGAVGKLVVAGDVSEDEGTRLMLEAKQEEARIRAEQNAAKGGGE
jgi:hypothetical protein